MIKLDELKAVLEPLIEGDNTASVIESITALDVYDENSGIEEAVAAALADNDASWNKRYKETFFAPQAAAEGTEDVGVATEESTDANTEVVVETFEDLFKEEQ